MSRPVMVLALCSLLVPARAGAQDSQDATALRARIDSLLPLYEAAAYRMTRADSIREAQTLAAEREPLDSVMLGPFMIVTQRSQTERLVPVVREVFAEHAATFMGLPDSVRLTMLVEPGKQYRAFQFMAKAPRHHLVTIYGNDPEVWQRTIRNAFDKALVDLAPSSIRAWLGHARPARADDSRDVYRELATSQAAVAKGCYRGEPAACAAALGVGSPIDSLGGYTPDQIRTLVRRSHARTDERLRSDCLQFNDTAKCLRVLSVYGGAPLPLGNHTRASLFTYALRRGGTGGASRLHAAAAATAADALSATARIPIEQLVRDWRIEIDRARAPERAGLGSVGLTTLMWAAIALAIALRSTRRRAS